MRRLVGCLAGSLLVAGLLWVPGAAAASASVVSVGDASVVEPSSKTGTVTVEVPVTIAPAAGSPVTVAWRTDPGTATTADYTAASGALTIPAGAQGGAIDVQVKADKVTEGVESFSITLTSAAGATLGDASGAVSIVPAGSSGLALGDTTVVEPDAGTIQVAVAATLGAPARGSVTLGWHLQSGTGTIGSDAPAASGTATIPKGALGTLVRFAVNGDTAVEADETLSLVVTSVSGASLADGLGTVTIRNNDVDPFGWQPPGTILAGTQNVLYVDSPAGDYVGQGRIINDTQANSLMQLAASGATLTLNAQGDTSWTLQLGEAQGGTALVPGYYGSAARFPFFYPGVSFTGDGRGCNTVSGRFIVDSVTYASGLISGVTARFEQSCEATEPPLHGYLRWSRDDPTAPPPPGSPSEFAWQPPDGAVPASGSYLYVASPSGDFIGMGQTFLDTPQAYTFVPSGSATAPTLRITNAANAGDYWVVDFRSRYNQSSLATGFYPNVLRAPFANPATGGFDIWGSGRACNNDLSSFAVDQISFDALGLASITARFTQSCEGTMPALYGALRWARP
jgi:hypothetical protein